MATSLPPNATPAEIEEELVFAKVLADSLDREAEDYPEQLMEAQARVTELENMLGLSPDPTLASPTGSHESVFSGQDMAGLDGFDERAGELSGFEDAGLDFGNDLPLTSPALPTFTLDTMTRKRPHGELSSPLQSYAPNKSFRPTPAASPSGTSPNTPGSESSLERDLSTQSNSFSGSLYPNTLPGPRAQSDRFKAAMQKQIQAENDARRRAAELKAQRDADLEFARRMSGTSFQSGPSSFRQPQFGQPSSQTVLNRDGTFRIPTTKKQPKVEPFFKSESSASPFSAPARPGSSIPPSYNGFATPSTQNGTLRSNGVKAEPSSSNQLQQNGESSRMEPWAPRIKDQATDSDSSDLEEIDAEQFSTSTRKKQQNTTMPGGVPTYFGTYPQLTGQNLGYASPGMMQSYNHQRQPTPSYNFGTQPARPSYNGASATTAIPIDDWTDNQAYWDNTANSAIGGFTDNLAMLGSMVGLGPSRSLGNHYSMPGAFPGSSMTNRNIFGSLGYNVNNIGQRQPPIPHQGAEVIDVDALDADRSRFDYLYSDASKTSEEIKKLIENIAPGEDVPPEMREGTPNAMRLPLLEHQKIGLAWLKKQEEGTNKGGILADDMGLGKTIQAIALMCSRLSEDPRRKTTLIIAPVALMRQWEYEIKDKLKDGRHAMSVFKHHGSSKKTFKDLAKFDVVLTTFGTLAAELRKKERWESIVKVNPEAVPTSKERLALLDKDALWYRIIIDEAQCIKNKSTLTAKAAYQLKSQYRLCMTGTPMMNNVGELFSLIHFCRIRPFNNPDKFKSEISNPLSGSNTYESERKKAMTRLHTLIRAIMLRRTKESKLDGKPIISLPPRTTETANVEFDEHERDFYTALETQTQLTFNRYMKAGSVMKNYANVLVLLLRLRQACCHPHLIRDYAQGTADVSAETMEDLAKTLSEEVITRIMEADGNFECPICYDGAENPSIFIPCGHDTCSECFARLTDPSRAIGQGSENAEAKCPQCRGKVDPKKIIDYATFKKVHMPETFEDGEGLPADVKTEVDEESDDDDSDDIGDSEDEDEEEEEEDGGDETLGGFVVPDGVEDDDAGEASTIDRKPVIKNGKGKATAKGKGKGKKSRKGKERVKEKKNTKTLAQLRTEGLRNKSARRKYLRRLAKDYIASAKISRTLKLLEEIHQNNPQEKVLIFSQFTSLLDLLEVPMATKPGTYRRYDGSMNPAERNEAVMYFKEHPECTVILVSLKAGNAGLNLNCASQVIIMDPFWNPYIEEQAIDRAHRIGQMNPVKVHKVLVPGTVEDRIVALQEKKRSLISAALDENAGKNVARLGLTELAYLFGVSHNPNSTPVGAPVRV